MPEFAGKGAIVTGGGSGIGLAIARRLASKGARLALAGRDEAKLASARTELEASGAEVMIISCSVAEPADVDRLVESAASYLERVDVVINSAGVGPKAPFLEMQDALWDETFAINTKGVYLVSQRAALLMARDGEGGAIVNIASMDALVPERDYSAYSASKAAVVTLTKAMATELAPFGIRVNAVSPGWTMTPIVAADLEDRNVEDYLAEIVPRIPLGRPADPDEIAAVVTFLASEDASYVTGQNVLADGGRLIAE